MKDRIEMTQPTDYCTCDHMFKSHKTTARWNNKKGEMDVRLKCRYCNCNILLEHCDTNQLDCSEDKKDV